METLEFNIDASTNNMRIDRYLANQCPEHSRSYIQKLLKEEKRGRQGRFSFLSPLTNRAGEGKLRQRYLQFICL